MYQFFLLDGRVTYDKINDFTMEHIKSVVLKYIMTQTGLFKLLHLGCIKLIATFLAYLGVSLKIIAIVIVIL